MVLSIAMDAAISMHNINIFQFDDSETPGVMFDYSINVVSETSSIVTILLGFDSP